MKGWAWAGTGAVLFLAGCAASPLPAETVVVPGPTVTVEVPGPTVTVTLGPKEASGSGLTDGQRETLDVMAGRDSDGRSQLLDEMYCPMDEGGREYYAELIAGQIEGMTSANVMQYFDEVC